MEPARQKWSLTQEAFDGLLLALGPDRDAAAAKYLEIRGNLVRLLEWRGCPTPDEFADEALNRCARKIAEGDEIRDLATYSVGIARVLLREMSRIKEVYPLEAAPEARTMPIDTGGEETLRSDCLERCLGQLSAENQNLILHYYQGDKSDKIRNRKGLLEKFGIGASTLRMRALRLRERLQMCAEDCVERRGEIQL